METINNVANAAAKAVWGNGDANKEPVSGVTGDVATGQPYDAGNLDPEDQKRIENDLATPADEPASTSKSITNNNKDSSGLLGGGAGAAAAATTTTASTTGTGNTEASLSHRDDSHKQSDTRHPDAVGSGPESESATVEPKGPGPRPLEAVAREHGGDAGRSGLPADTKPSDVSSSSNGSNAGTGEEYVKTTGFVADGGDFDATKPGAGKEADRLVEEKGHSAGASSDATASSPVEKKHGRNKPSLSERIKAKFHKH